MSCLAQQKKKKVNLIYDFINQTINIVNIIVLNFI